MDVAKYSLCDPGDLHYCRDTHANSGHYQHVYFRRSHAGFVYLEHWDCVVRASHAEEGARSAEIQIKPPNLEPRRTRSRTEGSVRMKISAVVVFLTSLLLGLSACARSASVDTALQANRDSPPKAEALPGVPPSFNANRAMQYVKEIVAFGPRPIGGA